ncbi:TSP2 protein, partial [Polypterus senegalus]|nr:TSP2 protein [Polypterus senegalus]
MGIMFNVNSGLKKSNSYSKSVGNKKEKSTDPFKTECIRRKIQCHSRAICRLDVVTETFYCQCIPGHSGDGVHFCQEPSAKITISPEQICDGTSSQLCVIKSTPGKSVQFSISVEGNYDQYNIHWFKFYSSYGHTFYSYRKRLTSSSQSSANIQILNDGLIVKIDNVMEDDFFPNLFWAQLDIRSTLEISDELQPHEISSYEILNPSQLRFYFALDALPVATHYFSFENVCREEDFGKIRALIYDYLPGIPGKVMVAQKLFVIRKAKSIWTPWSPWSICSVTCGNQNQMRFRICTHPESGMRCLGPTADLKPCPNLRECPVDGGWSPWSAWRPCPVTCGLAVVSRSRICNSPSARNGGKTCQGQEYEEATCGTPVSGEARHLFFNFIKIK